MESLVKSLGTYRVITGTTEVIATYKNSDYLPILLKMYPLKWIEIKDKHSFQGHQRKHKMLTTKY
jgi:hypothetical protein